MAGSLDRRVVCRPACGGRCIALSISSPIPGMPGGKPAGIRCVQLTADNRCRLYGRSDRPAVCAALEPSAEMCGGSFEEAMSYLTRLEESTTPEAAPWEETNERGGDVCVDRGS
jgi:Fe-S-cluster containining protein